MICADTLQFPKRGRKFEHPIMGSAIEWRSKCRRYRIVRFVEFECGCRRFLAGVRKDVCADALDGRLHETWERVEPRRVYYRKLETAMRACRLDWAAAAAAE